MANTASKNNLIVILPFIYIVPSFLLYFIVLYVMLFSSASKKFLKTSFYRLFIMSAINNMLHFIMYFLYFKASNGSLLLWMFSFIPDYSIIWPIGSCLLYHTAIAQNFMDTFLTFNRFTVFILKASYQAFWRRATVVIFVAILVLPNLFTWHFFVTDVHKGFINASDPELGYLIDEYQKKNVPWMVNSMIMGIIVFTTATCSFFMNCFVFFKLIQQRMKQSNYSKQELTNQAKDFQLILFTTFIFFNQMLSFGSQFVFFFIHDSTVINFTFSIQYFIVDVNTLAPVWILFMLSTSLRAEVAARLCNVSKQAWEDVTVSSKVSSTKALTPK